MGVEWHTWGVENPPAVPEDWLCNTSTSVSTWINYSVWTLKGWCCGVREYSSWPYEWVNKLVMNTAIWWLLVHEIPSQSLIAMMLQVLQPPMALCQDERLCSEDVVDVILVIGRCSWRMFWPWVYTRSLQYLLLFTCTPVQCQNFTWTLLLMFTDFHIIAWCCISVFYTVGAVSDVCCFQAWITDSCRWHAQIWPDIAHEEPINRSFVCLALAPKYASSEIDILARVFPIISRESLWDVYESTIGFLQLVSSDEVSSDDVSNQAASFWGWKTQRQVYPSCTWIVGIAARNFGSKGILCQIGTLLYIDYILCGNFDDAFCGGSMKWLFKPTLL